MTWKLAFFFFVGLTELSSANVPEVVLRNSPVFVSRSDQVEHPETDRLLGVGYSQSDLPNGEKVIRYTAFFSDEDSITTKVRTDRQMARYGRRLDVEWAYEVRIDARTGRGKRRRYHCDVTLGIGHMTCVFLGKYYRDTDRPVLFVNARHNIFGDRPKFPAGSSRGRRITMEPSFEIPYPMSRDLVPVLNPEMLRASDEEIAREGKLTLLSTNYVFVRVRGRLAGPLHVTVETPTGETYRNGSRAADSLREMGLDLWGRESVVAIALPESERFAMKNGIGSFRLGTGPTSQLAANQLDLEEVGLYLVDRTSNGQYETTDLTSRISCENSKDLSSCRLN